MRTGNASIPRRIEQRVGFNGKTALVLSAGGMFGAYQAGVWDVLSRQFKPDIVVGASVGSLNGWLIAGGCSGEELVSRWMDLGSLSSIRWRFPRNLSDGVLDASRLEETIREMYESHSPRTEFGVVLTGFPRLKPALFRWPAIEWRHIAASCSVPLFLRHYRLDGSWYSDGGLIAPLPLWAAVEMGATRIVGVNLLKVRPWIMEKAVRALQFCTQCDDSHGCEAEVIDISPRAALGSARDSMYWTAGNSRRWIEQGRRDCEASLDSVVECVSRDFDRSSGGAVRGVRV